VLGRQPTRIAGAAETAAAISIGAWAVSARMVSDPVAKFSATAV